ncbi:MAG TPA: zinc-ribbon domain-containing protein [Steroidobacteraceae bacterium]|nr:zinc-ribbon domain-containing protein [Steroidobacteraceae bacterium]
MGLRKCPDCGHDVSTSAASCPSCGRPLRRAAPSVEISWILIIASVCAGVLVWRLSSRSETPSAHAEAAAPGTAIARPTREPEGLTASVGYNRKLAILRVENRDAFTWNNCLLSLNAHGISAGYTREVASIRPGITEAALLESAEFSGERGRRFDPSADVPATLDMTCGTPHGPQSYAGSFEP